MASIFMLPPNELGHLYDWNLILILIECLRAFCMIFLLRLVLQGGSQHILIPLKCINFSMDNAWVFWQIYGNIVYYSSPIHCSSLCFKE